MAGTETYYFGECTYYCARELGWVRGGWGNATDWCLNAARSGLAETMIPTVGAVVVYAAGDGYSTFGHCAIVRTVGVGDQFLVSEMNYVAWNYVDDRWSSSYDVECFILPPGVAPGTGGGLGGGAGPGDVHPAALEVVNAWDQIAGYWTNTAPQQVHHWQEINALALTIG